MDSRGEGPKVRWRSRVRDCIREQVRKPRRPGAGDLFPVLGPGISSATAFLLYLDRGHGSRWPVVPCRFLDRQQEVTGHARIKFLVEGGTRLAGFSDSEGTPLNRVPISPWRCSMTGRLRIQTATRQSCHVGNLLIVCACCRLGRLHLLSILRRPIDLIAPPLPFRPSSLPMGSLPR